MRSASLPLFEQQGKAQLVSRSLKSIKQRSDTPQFAFFLMQGARQAPLNALLQRQACGLHLQVRRFLDYRPDKGTCNYVCLSHNDACAVGFFSD